MNEFETGTEQVLQHMRDDYATMSFGNQHFEVGVVKGRAYDKIVILNEAGEPRSAAGFIVKKDSGKFRRGDLLKAASWSAPAKNFPRGNILEGRFNGVRWTGV